MSRIIKHETDSEQAAHDKAAHILQDMRKAKPGWYHMQELQRLSADDEKIREQKEKKRLDRTLLTQKG